MKAMKDLRGIAISSGKESGTMGFKPHLFGMPIWMLIISNLANFIMLASVNKAHCMSDF